MNTEQKKFKRVMKARERRKAYLRRKNVGGARTVDLSKFIQSLPIPTPQKKKQPSFFSRMKDKMFSHRKV